MQVSSSSESLPVIDSGEELPEISISRTRSLDAGSASRVSGNVSRVNRRTLRSPTWRIGANAPAILPGGKLGAQAQHLFANAVHNITPLRSQLVALFGKRSHMSSHVLAADLCGIKRGTHRNQLKGYWRGAQ